MGAVHSKTSENQSKTGNRAHTGTKSKLYLQNYWNEETGVAHACKPAAQRLWQKDPKFNLSRTCLKNKNKNWGCGSGIKHPGFNPQCRGKKKKERRSKGGRGSLLPQKELVLRFWSLGSDGHCLVTQRLALSPLSAPVLSDHHLHQVSHRDRARTVSQPPSHSVSRPCIGARDTCVLF